MLARDRGTLEHGTLVRRKSVETRGDQRVDRRRDCVGRTALRQHRRHLLEVERVALGRLRDVLARGCVERPLLRDFIEQSVRLLVGERLEDHAAAGLRQPAGTFVEQIRPRLYACDEAKQALRLTFHPPVPDGSRGLKLGLPPVAVLAFSTLPRWARRMYGGPGGPLSEAAATAGLRATRIAFSQQRLFRGVLRAIDRAETAGS